MNQDQEVQERSGVNTKKKYGLEIGIRKRIGGVVDRYVDSRKVRKCSCAYLSGAEVFHCQICGHAAFRFISKCDHSATKYVYEAKQGCRALVGAEG